MRIAAGLAQNRKALAICTGESVGQVASQTFESMVAINEVTNLPMIRPVVCMDKIEIIDLAKKIGTYETSIYLMKIVVQFSHRKTLLLNQEWINVNSMKLALTMKL